MRFDLTSLTDSLAAGESIQVNSANLTLQSQGINAGTANTNTLHIYAISSANADWIEGTKSWTAADVGDVTWGKKYYATTNWAGSAGLSTAGVDYNSTAMGSFDVDMTTGSTDVLFSNIALSSSVVEGWLADASSNGGMLLDMNKPNEGMVTFYSSEEATWPTTRPQLQLDYTVIPEPSTIGLFSISSVGILLLRRVFFN